MQQDDKYWLEQALIILSIRSDTIPKLFCLTNVYFIILLIVYSVCDYKRD